VEIAERLCGVGLPAARVDAFLDTLIVRGVVHQDLNLPDQTRDYVQQVAARLEGVGTPEALHHAEVFTTLAQLEARFGAAPAAERRQLMGRIQEQIERFAATCTVSSPTVLEESPIWEDVGTHDTSWGWDPAPLERNVASLARLQRILPLFDETSPQRLGLYRWFSQRYGEDGRCDDLLEVYRELASQPQAVVAQVMRAEGDPHAQALVELRRGFLRRLHEALERADGASTLRLDERLLDQTIDALAPWVPSMDSAAYWLQLVPESSERPASVVVNNVASGHGAYYSRFCELFEGRGEGEWSLGAAIRDSIRAENPRQADLTAVLGINVNLHPHLSPLELVYPGAIPTTGAEALTVRDLGIAADSSARRLRLYTRADGLPVDLVPFNFLFPAAAPMLYRFLCALGSSHHVRLRLWDRLRMGLARHRTHFPRLCLGELVLERQAWFLSSSQLEFLGPGTCLPTLELMQQTDRWRRARGLPSEAFVRGVERTSRMKLDEGWAKVTRQWAVEARSARRKPQYLDFRNPFLVRLLASVARSSSEGGLVVSECLPPTSIYTQGAGPRAAEEFLVELSTGGASERGR
ncbi:MAG: lantibiotic dehydratase, partial [Myxococcales bacterium]|nr:lantibiotic dehydratase [Myxococcales bacterium]